MTDKVQAYCVKCREKRDMLNAEAVYTTGGAPGTRGECPVCGTNLFRMGATQAHEGLPKPEIIKKPARKKSAKQKKTTNANS
jgi:DNA topoisomerase-1